MKKISLYLLVMIFALASIVPMAHLSADEAATSGGTISGKVKVYENQNARQHVNGEGYIPSQNDLVDYDQVKVTLFDANGQQLSETVSGRAGGAGVFSFSGLADGQYYLQIDDRNDKGVEHIALAGDSNWLIEDVKVQRQLKSEMFTIKDGNTVEDVMFVVVRKPYAFKTTTKIGNFVYKLGDVDKSEKELTYYTGGSYEFLNEGRTYTTFLGILALDKLADTRYNLVEPTLSEEERAYGYTFAGWTPNDEMLDRYPQLRGALLSTDDVLNVKANGDMSFRAVFTYPIHKVKFATDSEKGTIEFIDENNAKQDVAYLTFTIEGSGKKVAVIDNLPKVTAKDGYEFVGWYEDPTTNVIPDAEILDTTVSKDLTFYAKYRPIDKSKSAVPNIEPMVEDETVISGTGVAGSKIEIMLADGTTQTVTVDEDGTWKLENVTLKAGDIYSFVQTEEGKTESRTVSGTVIRKIVEVSENPIIDKIFADDLMITGKGIAGSTVIVTFNDGSKVATTVLQDGSWSVTKPEGVTLERGQTVSAVQVEVNKKASSSVDATVIEREKEVSLDPRIDAVKEDAKVITGRGIAGSTITVTFKDGTSVETQVKEDNTWTVDVPNNITLKVGDVVSSVQTEKGKLRSSSVDATVVCECDKEPGDNGGNENGGGGNEPNGGNDNNGGGGNEPNGGNDNNGGGNEPNGGGNKPNGGNTATNDNMKTPKTNNGNSKKTVNTSDDNMGLLFAGMLALSSVGIVVARKRYEK